MQYKSVDITKSYPLKYSKMMVWALENMISSSTLWRVNILLNVIYMDASNLNLNTVSFS